ncbi:MAG: sigma-70 family RNA polymerase sigma factor [Polyangiaceae bacterium]|nr:sigma-70 family RNA polymerase sigma factor [Polyangiaceae bacterium]
MNDGSGQIFDAMSDAREAFLGLVGDVRPELHRYCARMMGSVIEGEDVVQDTLAKAYYALSQMAEPPALKPWLFRIAHNTAMDHLRRYERKNVDLVAEPPEPAVTDEGEVDPELVEAALSVFIELPPMQRSALVLKDVLGHSLEQTAATMGTTVQAVKNALLRARASVVQRAPRPPAPHANIEPELRKKLQGYADLFNARDWDGLRALIGEECRLDLVSRAERRGAGVREYYARYEGPSPRGGRAARRKAGARHSSSGSERDARVFHSARMARRSRRLHPRLPVRHVCCAGRSVRAGVTPHPDRFLRNDSTITSGLPAFLSYS